VSVNGAAEALKLGQPETSLLTHGPLEELGHALQNFAKKHLQPGMIFQ